MNVINGINPLINGQNNSTTSTIVIDTVPCVLKLRAFTTGQTGQTASGTIDISGVGVYNTGVADLTSGAKEVTININSIGTYNYTMSAVFVGASGAGVVLMDETPVFEITNENFTTAASPCNKVNYAVMTGILATKINSPIVVLNNTSNPITILADRGVDFLLSLEDANGNVISKTVVVPKVLSAANFVLTLVGGVLTVTDTANSIMGYTVQYSLDNVNWQGSNVFSGLTGGYHVVYVKDDFGCSFSKIYSDPFFIINPYTNMVDNKFIGWTLDPKYITVQGPIETDRYYQFDYTMSQNVNGSVKTETINNKMLLFDGSNKINIGRVVHRFMALASNSYTPCTVVITVSRVKTTDLSVIDSQTLTVEFWAGWNKGIDKQFLDYDSRLIAGKITFYCFANLTNAPIVLRRYLNSVLVGTSAINTVNGTGTVAVTAGNAGDIISLEIINSDNSNSIGKQIFVMPEGKYYHELLFWNDYKVPNRLVCTGAYNIKSEMEYITNKTYINLVDHLENLTTTKETRITINTGWLMLRDVAAVEALLRSPKVMFGAYELVPVQKSIVNRDTENGLIEFGLEFIINRTNDETVYL